MAVFRGRACRSAARPTTIDPDALAVGSNIKVGGLPAAAARGSANRLVPGSRFVTFAGSLGLEPRAHEAGPGVVNRRRVQPDAPDQPASTGPAG